MSKGSELFGKVQILEVLETRCDLPHVKDAGHAGLEAILGSLGLKNWRFLAGQLSKTVILDF